MLLWRWGQMMLNRWYFLTWLMLMLMWGWCWCWCEDDADTSLLGLFQSHCLVRPHCNRPPGHSLHAIWPHHLHHPRYHRWLTPPPSSSSKQSFSRIAVPVCLLDIYRNILFDCIDLSEVEAQWVTIWTREAKPNQRLPLTGPLSSTSSRVTRKSSVRYLSTKFWEIYKIFLAKWLFCKQQDIFLWIEAK